MPMTDQDSYNVLIESIYAPTFFNKLASDFNWTPSSQEEAVKAMKMAGKVRNQYELQKVKVASQRVKTLDDLDNHLDSFLGVQHQDTNVKAAAQNALQYPQIREAAQVFSEYLASRGQ